MGFFGDLFFGRRRKTDRAAGSFLGRPVIHPELRKNRAWTRLTRPDGHRQRVEALGTWYFCKIQAE